jgi:hypothetical protein
MYTDSTEVLEVEQGRKVYYKEKYHLEKKSTMLIVN